MTPEQRRQAQMDRLYEDSENRKAQRRAATEQWSREEPVEPIDLAEFDRRAEVRKALRDRFYVDPDNYFDVVLPGVCDNDAWDWP